MDDNRCSPLHFGLIVSGHCEADFLPSLFRDLTERGDCVFSVRSRISQRRLIGQHHQQDVVVGTRSRILSKDIEELGRPVLTFIAANPCHFIVVIDDLEDDGMIAHEIFDRYYSILDDILGPDYRDRASMHFLCTMLEAYFFRDITAINRALGLTLQPENYLGDVEQIRHPKGELRTSCQQNRRSYDEREDGAQIMSHLDINSLLTEPNSCAYLRTLFAWCMEKIISTSEQIGLPLNDETLDLLQADESTSSLMNKMHLVDGIYAEATRSQLIYFGRNE